MNKRKKKALLTLLMVAVLGVVGGTFAYFMSEDTFTNIFSTKLYKMEVKETFSKVRQIGLLVQLLQKQ